MKTNTLLLSAGLALAFAHHVAAQGGSLTPPAGPPGPVMKSLDLIEARIPLVDGAPGVTINGATGAITISQPGSYYLTGNRTYTTAGVNGIYVNSSDVTLDLNGYALICTSVLGGSAVATNINLANVTVRNGSIRGDTGTTANGGFTPDGWTDGVSTSASSNFRVEHIRVDRVAGTGISLSADGTVEHCSVRICAGTGINAFNVLHCSVSSAGDYGIFADGSVESSRGESRGIEAVDHGILADTVSNSTGVSAGGAGIKADTVINSKGTSSGNNAASVGIDAVTALNCYGVSTASYGINGSNASNCYGTSTSGAAGIRSLGTASFCRGNRVGGVAIDAAIAIGCTAISGTINSPQKHLGTP